MPRLAVYCPCGALRCRTHQVPCGACGRPLGPETRRQRRARLLAGAGWMRITLNCWRAPDPGDRASYTLAAAWQTSGLAGDEGAET